MRKPTCTAVLAIALAAQVAAARAQGSPGPAVHWHEARVDAAALDPHVSCAIGRWMKCDIGQAVARGLFETGLSPVFPADARCRGIDEGYAISYAHKRPREVYHGGIDMPAPWGTPIIAAATGTVVAKYRGEDSPRGVELVLRHAPEETGIPLWIYTQYTHFSELPAPAVGQRVRLGERLGPTGNSGISPMTGRQSGRRRPAIHFGVFYSASPLYADTRDRIIPVDGYWMDPVALYRGRLPLDSGAMKALSAADKRVPVAVMFEDGTVFPPGAKVVWPYACARR